MEGWGGLGGEGLGMEGGIGVGPGVERAWGQRERRAGCGSGAG